MFLLFFIYSIWNKVNIIYLDKVRSFVADKGHFEPNNPVEPCYTPNFIDLARADKKPLTFSFFQDCFLLYKCIIFINSNFGYILSSFYINTGYLFQLALTITLHCLPIIKLVLNCMQCSMAGMF